MPKTATDTGNKITSGYALVIDDTQEYFETIQGAVDWAKQGFTKYISFFGDPSISDADKADDLLYGFGMIQSDSL